MRIVNRQIRRWGRKISPWSYNKLSGAINARGIINALTMIALFAGVCLFATSGNTRLDRYMTFTYAIVTAIGLQLLLRSLPAGLFLIWTAICFYTHPLTPILAALTAVIYGGGLYLLSRVPVSNTRIYNLICLYAIATVLWQVLQVADLTIGYRPVYGGSHTIVGLQTNVGETSALMAVCLPAFFRRRWVWLAPIPLAGLVMAQATTGMMAAGAVGIVYFLSSARPRYFYFYGLSRRIKIVTVRIAAVVLVLAAGAGYVMFADPFNWESHKNSRVQTWKESTFIALQKPFRGWGYGQFCTVVPLLSTPTQLLVDDRKRLYLEVEDKGMFLATANKITSGNAEAYYKTKRYPERFYFEAHNEYIEILFAAGIPGLVLLLSALGHILWRGWKSPGRLPFYGLLASCICAGVWFIWQIVPIAVVTVAWAGLCLAKYPEEA